MAWTSISTLYSKKCKSDTISYLKARIDYMISDAKTNNQKYVSSYQCEPDTSHILFEELKSNHSIKTGREYEKDIVALRVIQSFKGYETTPETANKIGYELAMKLTKGNHPFVVSTHIDSDNIHNHITWASTTLDCTRKYVNGIKSWKEVARESDALCLKYNLSIILPNPESMSKDYGSWMKDKGIEKPKTYSDKIKVSIDEILSNKPKTFDDFLNQLELAGYEIKRRKNIGIKGNGQKKFINLKTLGGSYTQDKIIDLILNLSSSVQPKNNDKIQVVKDLEQAYNDKGVAYSMWARRFNMSQLLSTINYMYDNGYKSYADIKAKYDEINPRFESVDNKIKSIDEKMKTISKMQKVIIDYSKTKETYTKYKMSGYSKKFKQENLKELTIFENAKKEFKELGKGKKFPTMQELKQEYAKLKSEKKMAYDDYKEITTDMQDLLNAKSNLEVLLQIDVEAKEIEKQKEREQTQDRKEKTER